jgi:FAD synthase
MKPCVSWDWNTDLMWRKFPEQDIHNETVSSTKIRQAFLDGNIQKANAYLDHHYIIMGLIHEVNPKLQGNRIPQLQHED